MLKLWLLALASGLLSMGLRGYAHPVPHRIGTLCLLVTSFFIGYALTGEWWIGALSVVVWLLLPWVEIATRVGRLRIPEQTRLVPRRAPNGEQFPPLREISRELDEEGFRIVDDVGWEWGAQSHFYRIFYHEEKRVQAAICLVEEGDFAFYYLSYASRDMEQAAWVTWNFPFSSSLPQSPTFHLKRVLREMSPAELLDEHLAFFAQADRQAVGYDDEEALVGEVEREIHEQIAYNLKRGLLVRAEEEGQVRYTWRGRFYVWGQFLLEFVRFS